MINLKHWLSAMRLRTLPLSVSGIILASFLAYYNGVFDWTVFIMAMLTTLALQILSNFANDYGDGVKGTDNSDRIGPERTIQSGKISAEDMFHGIRMTILIVIFLAIGTIYAAFGVDHLLYTLAFFILGGLAIYAAMKYTMGATAYGYKAKGDIMVFIFFGLLSVVGCYILYAKQFDHVVIFPALVVGLLSVGVLNLNNMRDMNSDKTAGKITVALKLGWENAKRYHAFLILSAMSCSLVFGVLYYTSPYNLIFIVVFIPLVKHVLYVRKTQNPKDLDGQLKVLALSTFAISFLMGLGHIYNAI